VNLRSTFHPSQQDDEEWLWRENWISRLRGRRNYKKKVLPLTLSHFMDNVSTLLSSKNYMKKTSP
jgi:hypothetical protein